MIYTVTFNPSLDYIVEVENYTYAETNRTSFEMMLPGGKGLNVSLMLKNLGVESTALGFLGGFVGEEIKRRINEMGVKEEFITLDKGNSRINMKIRNINGMEINGMGPDIPEEKIRELMTKISELKSGDILVLAGSIPASVPSSIYMDIMSELKNRDVLIVVDATKELLMNALQYKPFLIKPNNYELGEIFGVQINTKEEVIPYAIKLHEMGAKNVLVSMAGEGAVLVDELGNIYESEAPQGNVINAVGAGDSMVAGFVAAWILSKNYEQAFRMGLAAGSASAFSDNLASKQEVENVLKRL